MLWPIECIASIFFGFQFVSAFLKNQCDLVQRFSIGVPIGFFTFAWIVFLVSTGSELSERHGVFGTAVVTIIGVILKLRNRRLRLKMVVSWPKAQLAGCGVIWFVLGLVLWFGLLWSDRYSLGAGYGDLPFHLNLVSSFAVGCNRYRKTAFDIRTPFYSGERLAYPFVTNYLSAVLVATGRATLRMSLLAPSLFMAFSLVHGIFSLVYEFTRTVWATCVALVLFLTLGGHGWVGVYDLLTKSTEADIGIPDFVHMWMNRHTEYWFHTIFHILLPQRASLFSLPLCYWTIYLIIIGMQYRSIGVMIIAGILTGFTPLIQAHSYVGLAQWSITYCIINFIRQKRSRWFSMLCMWACYGLVANVMALPQFVPYIHRVSSGTNSFILFTPIWKNCSPYHLWWYGLGLFAAIAIIFGWINIDSRQFDMYFPSIVVFVIANLVCYQPWELDNIKVFHAAWIPVALGVVSQYIARLFERPIGTFIGVWVLFFSVVSSMLGTSVYGASPSQIFDQQFDWQLGLWISENTNVNSVFVVKPMHMHPVATIAGRQLFMGYGGWVHSHGLNYFDRDKENRRLGENPGEIKKFVRHNITHIISNDEYFPKFEREATDRSEWTKVYNNSRYHVWKLQIDDE